MRLRLFLAFALIIALTLASVAFFARQSTAREIQSFLFRGGMFGAEDLVLQLEAYYQANGTWDGVDTILPPSNQLTGTGGNRWRWPDAIGQGHVGADDSGAKMGPPQGISFLLADASGTLTGEDGLLDADQLADAIPLQLDDETVGYLYSESLPTLPKTFLDTNLVNRINSASLNAALFAGVIALILALLLAYILLRPVRQLTSAAANLAEGDLSQRVPVRGKDELASLSRNFNHMAASLEQAEASRRALTADIAHELRTPLAVQRANLEALQDGVYPLTAHNLTPILEQNQLLTRLVEDLRTLAMADSGELTLERTPTDLPSLAHRVIDRFQPQAEEAGVTIHKAISTGCPPLHLDPARIEQILNNLLSNALRHTPQAGRIEASLNCTAHHAELSIGNDGPGIPSEALPHIFKRFYRADKARSRDVGGTGLGLAIARQLAEAHHGQLTARNRPEGGARFTLTLPLGDSYPDGLK